MTVTRSLLPVIHIVFVRFRAALFPLFVTCGLALLQPPPTTYAVRADTVLCRSPHLLLFINLIFCLYFYPTRNPFLPGVVPYSRL